MDLNNKIIITVENPIQHKKLEITINRFSSIEDWKDVFKTILIHQTFDHDIVRDFLEPDEGTRF